MSTTRSASAVRLLAGGALLLLAGCSETLGVERFCEQLPAAVCARLLFGECAAEVAVRYDSVGQCIEAEGEACRALARQHAATFDEGQAFACVEQAESAGCEEVARAELHTCDTVFGKDQVQRPVTPLDAGAGDASPADRAAGGGR